MARKQTDGKYKIKTHKATAKRFRVTGTGKLMRTKIGKSHLRRRSLQARQALVLGDVAGEGSRNCQDRSSSGALPEEGGLVFAAAGNSRKGCTWISSVHNVWRPLGVCNR